MPAVEVESSRPDQFNMVRLGDSRVLIAKVIIQTYRMAPVRRKVPPLKMPSSNRTQKARTNSVTGYATGRIGATAKVTLQGITGPNWKQMAFELAQQVKAVAKAKEVDLWEELETPDHPSAVVDISVQFVQ